jgi:hypothetical protein
LSSQRRIIVQILYDVYEVIAKHIYDVSHVSGFSLLVFSNPGAWCGLPCEILFTFMSYRPATTFERKRRFSSCHRYRCR